MGRKITPQEIETIAKMRGEGSSYMDISGIVGHSVHWCISVAEDYGINKGAKPLIEKPAGPATRKCMCCRKNFSSHGIGNRLCSECANKSVSQFYI